MKRLFAVVISILLFLLCFNACVTTKNSASTSFFIGEVTEVNKSSVKIEVDVEYSTEHGKEVEIDVESVEPFDVGDEIRVYYSGDKEKVNVKSTELLLPASENRLIRFSESAVPENLINLNLKGDYAEGDCNCFTYAYRVVAKDSERTYLAFVGSKYARYMILGDMGDKIKAVYFVKLDCSQYKKYGKYYVVDSKSIVSAQVVDYNFAIQQKKKYENSQIMWDKPVIYLYPTEQTSVSVDLQVNGKLNYTYPDINNGGWKDLTVSPDGTITKNGREYYCLFWEGEGEFEYDFSKGFCVKGEDTAVFFEKVLKSIGLTDREAEEFIIYWLPIIGGNEYNLISFQGENYTDAARLDISPAPDSLLRVFMAYKPLEASVEIEPQIFRGFERNGFTVVEWGGGKVN